MRKTNCPAESSRHAASTCSRLDWSDRVCGAFPTANTSTPLFLSPGHAIFKLTYLSNHDYKHLYFESDAATVNEIMLKVSVLGWALGVRAGFCGTGSRAWRQPFSSSHWTRLVGPVWQRRNLAGEYCAQGLTTGQLPYPYFNQNRTPFSFLPALQ